MLLFGAPIDFLIPISLVLSVTLTSMMFMIPTPAVRSAIKLMMKAPVLMARCISLNESISDSFVLISKSLTSFTVKPLASLMAPIAWSMAIGYSLRERASTVMLRLLFSLI